MLDKLNSYRLLVLTGFLVLLYTISRLLFFAFNYTYFSDITAFDLFRLSFFAIRFDLSVIMLSNVLFIILYTWPFYIREQSAYRSLLKWIFIIVNGLTLFSNCADLAYFQFTLKRTTATVFDFFGGEIGNDLCQLLPVFMKDYWYVFIIWTFFIVALYYVYVKMDVIRSSRWRFSDYVKQFFIFILSIGIAIIIYRGGVQLKPISMITAGEYTSTKYVPLLVNTPFSILKTLDVKAIEPSKEWEIKDQDGLKKLYSTYKKENDTAAFKKLNVCIIILESFSKEYIGAINGKKHGYTPFLDSLIKESITFTNAFANGKTSIDGIPAIVSGIPKWMNEPFITSPYSTNQINSIAELLKKQEYYTAFFHGGTNGTMGFEAFSKIAGYNMYYGRTEYNNEKDFDGNWGIWDEPFLQYTAQTIKSFKQPFFVSIFTLSSHHPYSIPTIYKNRFKKGNLEIERCIEYSDLALKKFFETAKKMSWYKNTLFVLCADHTGVSEDVFYSNKVGNFAIPIVYYMPFDTIKKMDSIITQQIDIMPSILDYLNYPGSYFAFGNSVFDTINAKKRFAVVFNSDSYSFIDNNYIFQFDGNKAMELYKYTSDSLLKNNIIHIEKQTADKMEIKTKAIIQTYQQSLINNKMHH
jgi:phosphoglycerol transferase MdoB-like AlkP superfamily enzyme